MSQLLSPMIMHGNTTIDNLQDFFLYAHNAPLISFKIGLYPVMITHTLLVYSWQFAYNNFGFWATVNNLYSVHSIMLYIIPHK